MKSKVRWMRQWAVIGVLAAAAGAWADGYRNPPDGAFALGRIGGHIVDVDDATAVSQNPANLVGLREITIEPAITLGYSEVRFTDLQGNSATSADPWRVLPSAYAAMPLMPGYLTLGVGVNVPFGQSTRWDENSLFRYTAPYYARMTVVDVSPAIGVQITERISVGAGLDIYSGDVKFEQFIPWRMVTQNAADPDGVMKFTGDGYAVGGNVAMTVKITEAQRLAFTYTLPVNIDYNGDFDLSNIPQGVPASAASDFNTQFSYPQSAALGYSLRVTDTIRLEANVEWLDHSCNQNLTLDVGANNPLLNTLSTNSIAQDWQDTWTFGLGGDWQFAQNWQLRAGYLYIPTPVPQSTLIPSAAEQDQSVVSVGLGYRCSHHAVDLALAQGLFNGREVRSNQSPAYNGDYDFRSTLLGISYQYLF